MTLQECKVGKTSGPTTTVFAVPNEMPECDEFYTKTLCCLYRAQAQSKMHVDDNINLLKIGSLLFLILDLEISLKLRPKAPSVIHNSFCSGSFVPLDLYSIDRLYETSGIKALYAMRSDEPTAGPRPIPEHPMELTS